VGDGPLKEKLQDDIIRFNLNIEISGAIAWNELSDLYKNARCLILPSINETWGMVANEAIQMGIEVICSESCGCANDLVIDGYSGLVMDNFEFSESRNSYDKIIRFLKDFDQKNSNFLKNNAFVFDSDRLVNDSLHHLLIE
jgi:glycosyltransferase involved in cell wall biosynthesis